MGLLHKASKKAKSIDIKKVDEDITKTKKKSVPKMKVSIETTKWINKRLEPLAKKAVTLDPTAVDKFLKEAWIAVDSGHLHPLDVKRIKVLTRNILLAHKNKKVKIKKSTLELIDHVFGETKN